MSPRAEIIRRIETAGIVPVATLTDPERAADVAAALLAGGVGCIEVTFRTPAAAEAIARAAQVDGLLVGAGTILSVTQLHAAIDAGARFGVAPGCNPDVVEAAREAGLPFFPGVATPSEIERARALGADTVKVFPASVVGGPPFIRAVAAVYPDVRFIPTGGISPANLAEYRRAPGVLAVGGSWLTAAELVDAGRYDEIERLTREAAGAMR